jgi:hypothetical protein
MIYDYNYLNIERLFSKSKYILIFDSELVP